MFPPTEIVPPILILQVLAGIQIYLRTRGHIDWKLLVPTLIGALVAIPLGTLALDLLDDDTMRLVIGVTVLIAAAILMTGFRFKARPAAWLSGGLGLLAGVGSGAAGIPGPPVIVLFLSSPVSLAIGRATLSAFFLFVATASSAAAFRLARAADAEFDGARRAADGAAADRQSSRRQAVRAGERAQPSGASP